MSLPPQAALEDCILTGFHLDSRAGHSWQTGPSFQTLRPRVVFWPILLFLLAISTSPQHPLPPHVHQDLRQEWAPTSLPELVAALSITCILCQSHHKSVPSSIWRLVLLPKPSLVVGMGQGESLAFTWAVVTHPFGKG